METYSETWSAGTSAARCKCFHAHVFLRLNKPIFSASGPWSSWLCCTHCIVSLSDKLSSGQNIPAEVSSANQEVITLNISVTTPISAPSANWVFPCSPSRSLIKNLRNIGPGIEVSVPERSCHNWPPPGLWLFTVSFLVSLLVIRNGFEEELLHNFPTDWCFP